MSVAPYILDAPLPASQDFNVLRERGLEYIQQHSGKEWTNLNPADPGVTIWEQVCYALTELGYCNDLPIEDILTNAHGELEVHNRFYLPEQILPTAPVTADDYRKYLIDGVKGIRNALVLPAKEYSGSGMEVYQVYLLRQANNTSDLCKEAFFYLNASRNINQAFLMPVEFTPVVYLLTGSLEIDDEQKLYDFILACEVALQDLIFPGVIASGYNQIIASEVNINDVFNGPLLNNGWISSSALGEKRDKISAVDVCCALKTLPNCVEAEIDSVTTTTKTTEIKVGNIIFIDVVGSLMTKDDPLKIYCKGRQLLFDPKRLKTDQHTGNGVTYGPLAVAAYSTVPQSKYRDIESYYSIQNTFPAAYMVGYNRVEQHASEYKDTLSDQLRGYLTLFDQVLANQFSQLANIGTLFSFENPSIAAPAAYASYRSQLDDFQKRNSEYPVPFISFSPTYFYQPLYDTPGIRPLLKDVNAFEFTFEEEDKTIINERSWKDYKQDPYNAYMSGLAELMVDEGTDLVRRNDILNHLLARHGESSSVIDDIIEQAVTTGSNIRDKVVIKSLYLQNFALLSYNRHKGCNYLATRIIDPDLIAVPENYEEVIMGNDLKDGLLNARFINHMEHITQPDLATFSALELKICLLFGLKTLYRDFISTTLDDKKVKVSYDDEKVTIPYWMIRERKGLIMLESTWYSEYYSISPVNTTERVVIYNPASDIYYECKGGGRYPVRPNALMAYLIGLTAPAFNELLNTRIFLFNNDVCYLQQCDSIQELIISPLPCDGWFAAICDSVGFPQNVINILFPDFVPQFTTERFANALELCMQASLPVRTTYLLHLVPGHFLKQLIPVFAERNNYLRFIDVQCL